MRTPIEPPPFCCGRIADSGTLPLPLPLPVPLPLPLPLSPSTPSSSSLASWTTSSSRKLAVLKGGGSGGHLPRYSELRCVAGDPIKRCASSPVSGFHLLLFWRFLRFLFAGGCGPTVAAVPGRSSDGTSRQAARTPPVPARTGRSAVS